MRKKPPKSIDGFSPSGMQNRTGSLDFGSINSNKNEPKQKRINDFKRPDGFDASTVRNSSLSPVKRRKYNETQDKKRRLLPALLSKKSRTRLDAYARKARRKKRLKIAGIVTIVILAVFGFLVAKGYINLRKALSGGGGAPSLQKDVDPSQLRVEGDGRINVLLLGRGGLGHEGADLTDTIILVSIDPIEKSAGVVSIPRDLYVSVPGEGSMKINSVFYIGKLRVLNNSSTVNDEVRKKAENSGFDLIQKSVEDTLGIPVHYHAMIDFPGFKQAINTLGGIDVNVPANVFENMRIDGQPYTLNVKKGWHHFGGFEALAYSRSRYTSMRGDFDRSERQRLIIVAMKNKILSLGTFSNPVKISALLDQFGSHVQTNFSLNDLNALYGIGKEINSSLIKSIGLADPPNNFLNTANINGLSVVLPRLGQGNYSEIQNYIRNKLKDSYLKKENASVVVLNGTDTAGLATEKAKMLKSYGYRVIKVDNAPTKNYTKTLLIDMRHDDKKYTRHYLEKRFNIVATNDLPESIKNMETADFVIIIGSDTRS